MENSFIFISIVIPVYAGEQYLSELVGEIAKVRKEWEDRAAPVRILEAIFADDGSTDGSVQLIRQLQRDNNWVRLVPLSRNFGQHAATVAGVLHTSGDWVVTLDEDLQHPPSYILRLLRQAVQNKQDIVYVSPQTAVHQSKFRDWSSVGYKRLIGWLSGNPTVSLYNSFRLVRGTIARAAASVASHETYFDVALGWFSTRITSVVLPLIDLRYSQSKKSGYNLFSLLRHARRLFVTSEIKALRFGGFIGLAAMVASLLLTPYVIFSKQWESVRGWSSLILSIAFFGGVGCLLAGILIEYVTVLLIGSQGKPTFFVVDREQDDVLAAWFNEQGE
jgi:glycosyltransferase involved in cell wall biosynthesis